MANESDHPGGVAAANDAAAAPPHPIDHNEFLQDTTMITTSNRTSAGRMRNVVH